MQRITKKKKRTKICVQNTQIYNGEKKKNREKKKGAAIKTKHE